MKLKNTQGLKNAVVYIAMLLAVVGFILAQLFAWHFSWIILLALGIFTFLWTRFINPTQVDKKKFLWSTISSIAFFVVIWGGAIVYLFVRVQHL